MKLRAGTRGSPLARWQTDWVAERIREIRPDVEIEIVPIRTSGDRFSERAFREIGVGVFTREIDERLLGGEIDLAVHSLKDLPTDVPLGIVLAAVPRREDPRDALVGPQAGTLTSLPRGAVVGTGSPRRRSQLLRLRPDLRIEPLRGNVETRLRKIRASGWAATVLASAGLDRLGLGHVARERLDPAAFIPAVGQGALAVTARRDDRETLSVVARLDDPPSRCGVEAERAFLSHLGGGCQIPAGANARVKEASIPIPMTIVIVAFLAGRDGEPYFRCELEGSAGDPASLGRMAAESILDSGGDGVIISLRER